MERCEQIGDVGIVHFTESLKALNSLKSFSLDVLE